MLDQIGDTQQVVSFINILPAAFFQFPFDKKIQTLSLNTEKLRIKLIL